jgi:hypothetical protein
LKSAGPIVFLTLVVIGGIAACLWAADQFTPSQFSMADLADFPNIAARKYVVLEMLKRLDAAGGDLTLEKLNQIVQEPLVNAVSNEDDLALRTQNPNHGWQVEASETCDKVIVSWEPSKCAIKIVDIRGLFGPAKIIQANQIPETHNPAMMIFKKMWGHIFIAVEEDRPGHNDGFAKAAFFSRDTSTPDARRARLFRTGDWAAGKAKTSF